MASLIISREKQFLNWVLLAHIYSDQGKLGQLKAGTTEEFIVDEGTQVIHVKNGLLSKQKVSLNATADGTCMFKIYTHPAVGLIRIALLCSVLFFVAFLLFYSSSSSWVISAMFLVPIVLLAVVGFVFCRANYFVIKEHE